MSEAAIRLRAIDDTGTAFNSARQRLSGLSAEAQTAQSRLDGLSATIGSVGVALGTAIAGGSLKGIIDLADQMDDLSEKTGIAVTDLTALRYAGEVAGTPIDSLAKGIQKLSQNMATAAGGGKEQVRVFEAIGVSVKNASGSLRDSDKVLLDIADKFASYRDGAGKAALAVELFGKAGADLIPVLNLGGAGIERMRREGEQLGGVFNGDLARSAAEFNDNLTKIKFAATAAGLAIADALLPTLVNLTNEFTEGIKVFGSWRRAMWEIGAKTSPFDTYADGARKAHEEITRLQNQLDELTDGSLSTRGGRNAKNMRGPIEARLAEERLRLRYFDNLQAKALAKGADSLEEAFYGGPRVKPDAPTPDRADKAGKVANAYAALNAEIEKRNALMIEEATIGRALTESERFVLDMKTKLGDESTKLTDAQREELSARLASTTAIGQTLDIHRREVEVSRAARQEAEKTLDAQRKQAQTAEERVRAQYLENESIGQTATAVAELEAARLREEAAALHSMAIKRLDRDANFELADATMAQVYALRQLADAKVAGAVKRQQVETAKEAAEEWRRTSDKISDSLTDALMRGFEGGKGFLRNFRDTVVNMFKTMVLRPVIQAIVNPVAGALAGSFGLAGTAAAASGGAGALSTVGNIGGALSGLRLLGGNFGGGFMSGIGGWLGSEAGIAGTLDAGMIALQTGNIAGGLGSIAGTIAPPLLALAALASLASLAKATKGETRAGGQYGYSFDGVGALNPRRGTTVGADKIGAVFLEGPSGGDPNQAQAMAGVNALVTGIDQRFKALGSDLRVTGFAGGYEGSEKGRGGVFSGVSLSNGRRAGESGQGDNYAGTLFESTTPTTLSAADAYQAFTTDLLQLSVQALQQDGGLPAAIKKLVDGIDAEALTAEAATQLLATVDTVVAGVNTLRDAAAQLPFENLAALSFDTAASLIELAGGLSTLQANIGTYYQEFYTGEERASQLLANLTNEFAGLGLQLPTTRDGFRALVDAQDLTTEAGQKTYAALLGMAGAFASIVPAAEDAAAAAEAYSQTMREAADSAYQDLERAVSNRKAALQSQRDVAAESVSAISATVATLTDNIRDLLGQVDSTRTANATAARQFIANAAEAARSTGYLPDQDQLAAAISDARAGIDSGSYRSRKDQDFDRLVLANQLAELKDAGVGQLTAQEQVLQAIDDQLQSLDDLLATEREELDVLKGISANTLTVAEAQRKLDAAQAAAAAAKGGTSASAGASGQAVFGGTSRGAQQGMSFTIDENGFRRYADGSGSMLSEGELDLWRRGLLGKVPLPSFAVGTDFVPHDMLAQIHKGERITPAAYNRSDATNRDLQRQLEEVKDVLRELIQIQKTTRNILDGATSGGGPLMVQVIG